MYGKTFPTLSLLDPTSQVMDDDKDDDLIYYDVATEDNCNEESKLPKRYFYQCAAESKHTKVVNALTVLVPKTSGTVDPAPLLISVSDDSYVKVWDLYSMKFLQSFDAHAKILQASGSSNRPLITNRILAIASYAIDCDDNIVVTGAEDKLGIVWDPLLGKEIMRLDGFHTKAISCISIIHPKKSTSEMYESPLIILVSHDKTFSIWHYKKKQLMHRIETGHTDLLLTITAIQIADQDTDLHEDPLSQIRVITGSWDKTIRMWNWQSPTSSEGSLKVGNMKIIGKHTKCVSSIVGHVFEMQGRSYPVIVSGSLDRSCGLWSLDSNDTSKPIRSLFGHTGKVSTVKIYYDPEQGGPPMIISASEDSDAVMWDLQTGEKLRVFSHANDRRVTALDVFPSKYGLMIVTGCDTGDINVWNLCNYDRCRKLTTPAVTSIDVFEPRAGDNCKSLVIIGTIKNKCSVYELESGKEIGHLAGHRARINALVVYSPPELDEPPLVIACDGVASIKVWNLFTQKEIGSLEGHYIAVLALALYDPRKCRGVAEEGKIDINGPLLISGGIDRDIRIWDFYRHKCIGIIEQSHYNFVRSIVVHHPTVPGDPLFVTGSYDMTAKLWNLRTLEPIATFEGFHKGFVFMVNIYNPLAHVGERFLSRLPEDMRQPIVVTGGYDNVSGVWNMTTRKLLRSLRGHSESVTAQSIYVPSSADEDPLVITGSIDKSVIIWNLITGERIQTLLGHTDRVCYIYSYLSPAKRSPVLISGGDDEVVILWEDTLYQKEYAPLRNTVVASFKDDMQTEDWPLLSAMEKKFGLQLFVENSNLFYLAVIHDRPDFILKFRKYLTYVLPFMKKIGQKSLLMKAVECSLHINANNLIALRAILLSWVECLNTDSRDMLTQTLFHPSYGFDVEYFKSLADLYPKEFINFVTSLRLVRNSNQIIGVGRREKIRHPDHSEVIGLSNPSIPYEKSWLPKFKKLHEWHKLYDMIELMFNQQQTHPLPVASLMIPLQNTSNIDIISIFVNTSISLKNVDIFASPVGEISLRYFWENVGRDIHIKTMITYILSLILFMFCLYTYQFEYDRSNGDMTIGVHTLNVATLIMFFLYLFQEYKQFQVKYRAFARANRSKLRGVIFFISHFIVDVWNMFDWVIIFTGIVGLLLRMAYGEDTKGGRIVLAITSILMWFKVLYFMRSFSNSGPLVAVILRVLYEIRFFLLVLFCVLAGFAQAFWMLSNVDRNGEFGNIRSSLYHAFLTMLGGMTPEFESSMSKSFSIFLLCIFMMTMIIVMLNILIALMNDVFADVRSKGLALWRREQASILLDQVSQLKTTPSFIHILKYTSDISSALPLSRLQEMVTLSKQDVREFTELD